MRTVIIAALFAICSTLAGAEQKTPLAQRMEAFAAAYNAADGAAVAAFYTKDGALLPPGAGAVVGQEAIAAHYQRAFDAGVRDLRYQIVEIRSHGAESAVEIGETLVRLGDSQIKGRYLHVWVLQDGLWRLSRDIYHLLATE